MSSSPAASAPAAPEMAQPVGIIVEDPGQPRGFVAPDITTMNDRKLEFARKNPFVLLGTGVTIAILFRGLLAMQRGDRRQSQMMMRGRVLAQGATIAIMVASASYVKSIEKMQGKVEEAPTAPKKRM